MDVQRSLRTFSGFGSPWVTSNSAKELVDGKTASVIKGRDTLIPSRDLEEFQVGDWIRIGEQSSGPLFSILEKDKHAPYVLKLSSTYMGQTMSDAQIFRHCSLSHCTGYQYIISFDPELGDISSLEVDGTDLVGNTSVISFDESLALNLIITSKSSDNLEGTFAI